MNGAFVHGSRKSGEQTNVLEKCTDGVLSTMVSFGVWLNACGHSTTTPWYLICATCVFSVCGLDSNVYISTTHACSNCARHHQTHILTMSLIQPKFVISLCCLICDAGHRTCASVRQTTRCVDRVYSSQTALIRTNNWTFFEFRTDIGIAVSYNLRLQSIRCHRLCW